MEIFSSVSPGIARTREMLFRPFSLGKWFALGFVFFLQALVEGGFGNRYDFNSNTKGGPGSGSGHGSGAPPSIVDMLQELRKLVHDNAGALAILVVTGALIGLVIVVVFGWLGTRGQMMAIRNVARGEASVSDAWRETAAPAWSLFRIRMILSAAGLAISVPLFVFAITRTYSLIDEGVTEPSALAVGLLPFVVLIGASALVFGFFEALVRNFVAPLMWRFDLGARDGVSRFFAFARGRWIPILGFLVLRFVASLVVGLLSTVVATCTCCIGALPILSQTIFAPWHVFERAWSLYAIESAGPEWAMVDSIEPPSLGYPPAPPPPMWGGGGYGPPPGPYWPGH